MELNLHPPILVGVNLLARRAGDDGGLRALDGGLWGNARRAVGLGGFDGGERALEQVAFGGRVGGGDVAVQFKLVIRGDDEVVAVLLVAAMPGELEQAAHAQATGVAVAGAALEFGAALLHAAADKVFAVADFDVTAGVVELLVARVGVGHLDDGLDPQVGLGLLEVVVGQRMDAGLDFPSDRPCVNVVGAGLVGAAGFGVVGDFFVTGEFVVGGGGVGEDEVVLAVFMGEVIINALLLHQPAGEVEVGLAVLDAVFAGGINATELFREVGKALVAEHLLDDVRDVGVLEDAAVGGAGQKPQPRA